MTAATPLLLAGMIILTALMMIAVAVSTLDNLATRRSNRNVRELHDAMFTLADSVNADADRIEKAQAAIRDLADKINTDLGRRSTTLIWEGPSV